MTFKFYLRMVAAAIATLLLAVGCSDDKTDDPNPDPDPDPTVDCTFDLEVYDITASSAFGKAHPSDATVTYYLGVVEKNLFDTFASDKAFQTNDVETMQKLADEDNIGLSEYLEARISVAEVPTLFSGLDASTDYYLYAYGITSNGVITTDLAKKEFTTSDPTRPMTFEIKVTGITPYGANVAVQPSGTSLYYYDVFEKAEMDKFANDAAIIAELEKSPDFEKGIVKGKKDYTYGEGTKALKPKTAYYAYAFEYGNPNVPAPKITKVAFTTKSDEPFNPTYASWLGKWKVQSTSSLKSGMPLEFEIEINQKVAGVSYTVKNWGITPWAANIVCEARYHSTADESHPAGALSLANQQSFGKLDEKNPDSEILFMCYYDDGGSPMIVTGKYDFTGTLNSEDQGKMDAFPLELKNQAGETFTKNMIGGDIFGLNFTTSEFLTYVPMAEYKDSGYPIGPYTLTRAGEVDHPSITFDISVTNITDTSMHLSVVPSNNTDTYFCTTLNSSWEGATDESVITQLDAFLKEDGSSLLQSVVTGPINAPVDKLAPGSKYFVVAFGYDATGATTAITWKEFRTTGGGDQPGDGPALELTAKAGDKNGANTDTKGYVVATSPTATSAKYGCWPKSTVDEAGIPIDAIVTQYGKDGDAQFMAYLKEGLGLTFSPLDPATTYTVIFKVTDAAGKWTAKSVDFTTTSAGGGGEASEAYNAWLGTWTVTSTSSEVSNAPISFDVTIAEKAPDVSFELTGWSILSARTVPVTVQFKSGNMVIPNDIFMGEVDLNGSDNGKGKVYYTNSSWITLGTGESGPAVVSGDYDAITAKMGADKASATATGFSGKLTGGGSFFVRGVDFYTSATVKGEDGWYNIYDPATGFTENDFPVGPYTMVKKSNKTAPMGAPVQFNLSSVLTASDALDYLVSKKTMGLEASSLGMSMVSEVVATSDHSNDLKNMAKLTNPGCANDMLTLGKPMRYMTAVESVMQTGTVNNLLRPIKKVEAAYKLGIVRNE